MPELATSVRSWTRQLRPGKECCRSISWRSEWFSRLPARPVAGRGKASHRQYRILGRAGGRAEHERVCRGQACGGRLERKPVPRTQVEGGAGRDDDNDAPASSIPRSRRLAPALPRRSAMRSTSVSRRTTRSRAPPDVVAGARARRAPRTGARTGRSICDFSLLPAPLLTKTRAIPDIAGCTTCRLHLIPEPHTGSVRKQPHSSRDPYRSPAAYPESPSLVVCGVPRPVLHSRGAGCGDRHGQSRYRGALGQYPPLQPRNQHGDQDGAI